MPRRGFLTRCCAWAGLLRSPALGGFVLSRPEDHSPQFHVHPHYREQTPLDAAARELTPGLDEFSDEKDHDRVASILETWRLSLLRSTQETKVIEDFLSTGFLGSRWVPAKSQNLPSSVSGLEVRKIGFVTDPLLTAGAFLSELQSSLAAFSQILIAEFQITEIEKRAGEITARVRYELVGAGEGFHREQRSGYWLLTWQVEGGNYQLLRWQLTEETRSRSRQALFADITSDAFGACKSYTSQLSRGADYWRTVLDGRVELISTATMAFLLGMWTGMDGTTYMFASRPAYRTGYIGIGATGLSRM